MKTIHKVILDLVAEQTIEVDSKASKPLAVLEQNGKLCLWYETYAPRLEVPTPTIKILIFGTGHDIFNARNMTYLGTVIMGPLVWHVYYEMTA